MKKRLVMLLIGATLAMTACGSGAKESTSAESAAESVVESTASVEESVEETESSVVESVEESVAEEPAAASDPNELADDNPLKGIADVEEMRNVYDEINSLMNESYLTGPLSTETDSEKIRELEDQLIQQVADGHGLTYDDVRNIYLYGGTGSLYNFGMDNIKLLYGELVDVTVNGTSLVVKAKIEPSYSNEATIHQNYFNVTDLVKNQNCGIFHEIQYWAVADMQSGDEGKVIQFNISKDVIEQIEAGAIVDNQLGDYATDLWILPSLVS